MEYDAKLKMKAVQYVLQGHTYSAAAQKFHIPTASIFRWVRTYQEKGTVIGVGRGRHEHKKLFPAQLQEYILHHPESTQQKIADYFNCSVMAVSLALRANNIPYTYKISRKINIEKLKEYISLHPDASRKEIAAYLRCKPSSLSLILRQHGINHPSRKRRSY